MAYQVNPRVDLAFKKIFGSPKNQDLLISLINSIVREDDQVESIELLNPYCESEFKEGKLSILDIKAKDKRGQYYNIEMQLNDHKSYDKRALYYWARLYVEQLQASEQYVTLRKTIGIHILNFTSIPNSKKYHNCFRLTEIDEGIEFTEDIEMHTIELSKFDSTEDEDTRSLVKKIKTGLDIWAAFLTRYNLLDKDHLPEPLNIPEVKKALGELERLSFDDPEREVYDARLKLMRDEFEAIRTAEEKGLEKGRQEGIEEGVEKGREEGKEEREKEIASQMKKDGMTIENIVKYTGLSKSEVEKL